MTTEVICTVEHGVACITLNRPEKLNAVSVEMGPALDAAIVATAMDRSVRAIVVTGAGRGFCAGADVGRLSQHVETRGKSFTTPPPDSPSAVFAPLADSGREFQARYTALMGVPKPVIAAVNGVAAGVGFALAMSCDVRFASENAMFSAIFGRRGLTAEVALAYTLPSIVGRAAAADILLSARKIHAAEALQMGLVNRVVKPDELLAEAMDYARDIAQNVSPRSTAVIKRQLWRARSQTMMEAMRDAHQEVVDSLVSYDFREGVAHYKEKRAARFTGV